MTWQLAAVLSVLGAAAGAAAVSPGLVRTVVCAVLAVPFAFIVVWRLGALVVVVITPPDSRTRPSDHRADRRLPLYSVLVPLVNEASAVPGLIEAIDRLDYPRDRLEVLLVLEAADGNTRRAVASRPLPPGFHVVVVPDGAPRTKPKALAYAITQATGDFVVVYDAEDTPAPSQLLRAAAEFDRGGPELGCLQARLDIDRRQRGWLARQFALEYAALFHGLLPVLAAWRLPIPLGGTSNHFRGIA